MSNYEDYVTDQAIDAAIQAQAEFERTPRRICAFHARKFPGEFNLIEDGGNGQTSHGCCGACETIEAAKADALLAEQRAQADHDDFLSYCEREGRENPYVDQQHFEEEI